MRLFNEGNSALRTGLGLPLPAFVLQPFTAEIVAVGHLYLAYEQLAQLFGGAVQRIHIWKSFGALVGTYGFAALASLGLARRAGP